MDIIGKIILALPEASGTSKAGNAWKKREYVLETIEPYPKKVCFTLFGDRADQFPMQVGEVKKISFDLESREYNGRWYTDVRAWKVEDPTSTESATAPQTTVAPAPPAPAAPQQTVDPIAAMGLGVAVAPTDDLPF